MKCCDQWHAVIRSTEELDNNNNNNNNNNKEEDLYTRREMTSGMQAHVHQKRGCRGCQGWVPWVLVV